MPAESWSGGGIVRTGNAWSGASDMRAFRRRWASGVCVVIAAIEGGFRGVTVSSLLPISVEPPIAGIALELDASFRELLAQGTRVGISLLHRDQEFLAERFAGRAPLPDPALSGIPHRITGDVAHLTGAIATATGTVMDALPVGDHVMITLKLEAIDVPPDSDEPMIVYEGAYRDLEPA